MTRADGCERSLFKTASTLFNETARKDVSYQTDEYNNAYHSSPPFLLVKHSLN